MSSSLRYYAILGVSPSSDEVVIRAAFKALMLKYHPDTNKSADATDRAKEINEAFSIIGDPQRRAVYDQRLKAARAARSRTTGSSSAPSPPPPPHTKSSRGSDMPPVQPKTAPPKKVAWSVWLTIFALSVGGAGLRAVLNASPAATPIIAAGENSTVAPINRISNDGVAANNGLINGGMMDNGASAVPPPAMLAMPALEFSNIEAGARDFASVLKSKGIIGARQFSVECHAGVKAVPSWSVADYCAAFDYSAAAIDAAFTKLVAIRTNQYFVFKNDNEADDYQPLGSETYALTSRLQSIRHAAVSAASAAIETSFASNQVTVNLRQNLKPAPVVVEKPLAPANNADNERD